MSVRFARRTYISSTRPLERLLAIRIPLSVELLLYVAVFALAFALRFWDLGARALHHDESIHAQWSWRLIQGTYAHDPIFHGPFYYHAQGLVFLLFGSTDYTSRVSAALFGIGLVALPLLIRRWLGPVGTFATIAFIAFSPTIVYYSRFVREDIYMAFFVMLMVAAILRYVGGGRDRWLVVFALAFTGSILTKEATYITVAVFLVFLDLWVASLLATDLLNARREPITPGKRALYTALIAPFVVPIITFWAFIQGLRTRFGWLEFHRPADVLIILGTLTLPLLTPVLQVPLGHYGIIDDARLICRPNMPANDAFAIGGLFAVMASLSLFAGLNWRPRIWGIALGLSALLYLTFMTSFWTNLYGACTGPWGSLDYWMSQHGEVRGDQPWFYYFMLMPAYEFLPLVIAVGGIWWSLIRGTAFSRFLIVWLVGTWIALSWAGEKMPWLNTHIALPACVLAGWTIQRAWQEWRPRPDLSATYSTLLAIAALSLGGFALIAFLPTDPLFNVLRVAIVGFTVFGITYSARPFGRSAVPTIVVVAIVAALSFISVRTMVLASFERGDVPKDLLVYTQSAPDIPQVKSEIDALAAATGRGFNLPIAVDTTDSFAWPWAWYLRDYKAVSYADMRNGPPAGDYPVLLVARSNIGAVNDKLGQTGEFTYGAPRLYPHRWWFEEAYKNAMNHGEGVCTAKVGNCGPFTGTLIGPIPNFVPNLATWGHIASNIFTGSWLDTWFYFWRDKDPDVLSGAQGERRCNSCGSVDAYAFFPANFNPTTGSLQAGPIEAAEPGTDKSGRLTFGGAGTQPGRFLEPVDVEGDTQGNLYVIDRQTRRVQKFDAQGNFIAAADVRGENPAGQASEPWGLAIGPAGQVIVADTFGWTVRVLDPSLRPLTTIGKAPEPGKAPGPFDLFGPRDAAIDPQGNLWVTDTGHARIQVYTLTGQFVRTVGGRGSGPAQFNEPVGITISPDGLVFVADMYNKRVQILDLQGAYVGEIKVEGWGGQEVTDKPYLEALRDGRIAVSLPRLNRVEIYTREGTLSGTIAPGDEPLARPYGIFETPDAKLWIAEAASGRLRLFDRP